MPLNNQHNIQKRTHSPIKFATNPQNNNNDFFLNENYQNTNNNHINAKYVSEYDHVKR